MSSKPRSLTPGRRRTRIVLVDDHPLVRERLSEIVQRESDLQVCGEAEDRHDALEVVAASAPDLVILDITLKNSDGLELIKDISARWPKLTMLVVSMHDESLYAERVLSAGARGYITKQEATRNILQAIRQVLAGHYYVNESCATRVFDRLKAKHERKGVATHSSQLLADRELQIFELTGRGFNTRQIAQRLNLGVKSIETYRRRVRDKLGIKNPDELLSRAITWVHHR